MKYKFNKDIILINLGGSIFFPDKIDAEYIKRFNKMVRELVKQGKKIIIVIGGGALCRDFNKAASKVRRVSKEDKDWLGIKVTRLNAQFLRTIFQDIAAPLVLRRRHKIKKLEAPVTISAGWSPGNSTDYVGTVLAHDFKVEEVIFAGKPDFVYDKDPEKYKTAKAFTLMSWEQYQKIIPKKWIPGFKSPVDPIAAKFAKEHKIKGIVIDGRKIGNFKKLLAGKEFQGTVIE